MSRVTDHFRQKKTLDHPPPAKAGPAPKAGASKSQEAHASRAAVDDGLTPEERALRQFDLDPTYGPCIGSGRLER